MIKDKVALITGAGSGIGRGTAIRLARDGAKVIVVDVNSDSAVGTVNKIKRAGGRAYEITADVANVDAVRKLVDEAMEKSGRIDILVNNAGVTQIAPFLELDEHGWDKLMLVNLRGLFFCMQEVAKRMIRKHEGKIVNVASVAAFLGTPLAAHYAASKAGVVSLTRSAALALVEHNIQVNAVCPGPTDTPMWGQIDKQRSQLLNIPVGEAIKKAAENIPMKRFATPQDIAGTIAFLSSRDADYITGQTIIVDGGVEAG